MNAFVVELSALPLVILANIAVGKRWAGLASELLPGLVGGGVCLFGALDLAGAQLVGPAIVGVSRQGLDGAIIVTGFVAAVVAARPVRDRVARAVPIDADNPVHALALSLAAILFGFNVATVLFTDTLGSASSLPPLSVGDLVLGESAFLILAFVGVGVLIRREPPGAMSRLGLVWPRWWQVSLALAAAGIFVVVAVLAQVAGQALTPELARRIADSNEHTNQLLTGSLLGVIALGLAPGLCEDVLFRGALQPRLGLVPTAIVFTSLHVQYSLSIDTLAILVLAVALGLIRKYTNTTTSASCHCAYNLLGGVSLGGATLVIALVVETALLTVTAYAIWAERRRRSTEPS